MAYIKLLRCMRGEILQPGFDRYGNIVNADRISSLPLKKNHLVQIIFASPLGFFLNSFTIFKIFYFTISLFKYIEKRYIIYV